MISPISRIRKVTTTIWIRKAHTPAFRKIKDFRSYECGDDHDGDIDEIVADEDRCQESFGVGQQLEDPAGGIGMHVAAAYSRCPGFREK